MRTTFVFLVAAILMVAAVPTEAAAAGAGPDLDDEQSELVDRFTDVVRCVMIDQETFCTELGFITTEPGSGPWRAAAARMLAATDVGVGDMSTVELLEHLEALPRNELAARQNEQVAAARDAVGRLKLVEMLSDGEAIPAGFFNRYPSLGVSENSATAAGLRAASVDPTSPMLGHLLEAGALTDVDALDPFGEEPAAQRSAASADISGNVTFEAEAVTAANPPSYRYIIYSYYVEQSEDYYCGPATMDAIDWADDGGQNGQSFWAGSSYLRTDQQGSTSVTRLIGMVNTYTSWDTSSHGGSYSLISVDGRTKTFFVNLHRVRIGVYGAPVIEHPLLRTAYFPYLRYDHSGHFQTGRGYSDAAGTISIFEPYDERDWCSGGYHTGMVQYVPFANLYNATKAHPQQNLGA